VGRGERRVREIAATQGVKWAAFPQHRKRVKKGKKGGPQSLWFFGLRAQFKLKFMRSPTEGTLKMESKRSAQCAKRHM